MKFFGIWASFIPFLAHLASLLGQMNQNLVGGIWSVFYADCACRTDLLTNMDAIDNSCFLLVNF